MTNYEELPIADIASLPAPFYALSTKEYEFCDHTYKDETTGKLVELEVTPPPKVKRKLGLPTLLGRATIDDKDIVLYALTLMHGARKKGKKLPVVQFTVRDFLAYCGKEASGPKYDQTLLALERLRFTSFRTNIATGKKREVRSFSMVSEYSWGGTGAMRGTRDNVTVKLVLCQWLQNAVVANEVLQLDAGYFDLRPLEKRVYEIARKFCGDQPAWQIKLTGLRRYIDDDGQEPHKLRAELLKMKLPGYRIKIEACGRNCLVKFYNRKKALKPTRAPLAVVKGAGVPQPTEQPAELQQDSRFFTIDDLCQLTSIPEATTAMR